MSSIYEVNRDNIPAGKVPKCGKCHKIMRLPEKEIISPSRDITNPALSADAETQKTSAAEMDASPVHPPKVKLPPKSAAIRFQQPELKKIIRFSNAFAGVFGGGIVAVLGVILVAVATAGPEPHSGWSFFMFFIAAFMLALTSPNPAKAWRRVMITSSVFSFALPLSFVIFTGAVMTEADSFVIFGRLQEKGKSV